MKRVGILLYYQRCIFSICARNSCCGMEQEEWVELFFAKCKEKGVDYFGGGEYQKRLEIFRSLQSCEMESLKEHFTDDFRDVLNTPPSKTDTDLASVLSLAKDYNFCKSGSECVSKLKPSHKGKLKHCSGWYVCFILQMIFYNSL